MESIKEKIAYLRGIIDGDASLKEERIRFLFEKTMLVLEEIAEDLDQLILAQEELEEYLQEIDFDLTDLEDDFYVEEEDEYAEDWDDPDSPKVPLIELECPQCQEIVAFDQDFLFDQGVRIRCPRCGAVVFESDDLEEAEELLEGDEDPETPDD